MDYASDYKAYPQISTCVNKLMVPNYQNRDTFKTRMNSIFKESQNWKIFTQI